VFKVCRPLAMLLLLWLPCAPQSDVRYVTGVVTDKRGNRLPGAAVQLENTFSLFIMSHITDKAGRYYFNRLSDDYDYTLRAQYRNVWSKSRTLSKFNSAKNRKVDLVIPID
jgi:hypothetical protein